MKIDILISGFGGQGMMSLGKVIARTALLEGKCLTGFPSYGAEMRGGTAHCFVRISNTKIASPFIVNPDIAIIFNQPSLDKFRNKLKNKSLLILNSDLVNNDPVINGVKKVSLPLNKIALECENIKTANMVALGVLLSINTFIKKETVIKVLKETFINKGLQAQNLKAFNKGLNILRDF